MTGIGWPRQRRTHSAGEGRHQLFRCWLLHGSGSSCSSFGVSVPQSSCRKSDFYGSLDLFGRIPGLMLPCWSTSLWLIAVYDCVTFGTAGSSAPFTVTSTTTTHQFHRSPCIHSWDGKAYQSRSLNSSSRHFSERSVLYSRDTSRSAVWAALSKRAGEKINDN